MNAAPLPRVADNTEQIRLFFALWPPAPAAAQLHALTDSLLPAYGGRAMREDTLHVTLAFLGNVPRQTLDTLFRIADGVELPVFDFCIDTLGFWQHSRILWAGAATIPERLGLLAATLQGALQQHALLPNGGPDRPYLPHVTLLRNVRETPSHLAMPRPIVWPCESFALVRSLRSARGADYEKLGEWRLR